jgi:hypothetical protein
MPRNLGLAATAGILCLNVAAQAAPVAPLADRDAWKFTIAHTPIQHEGCFSAIYPSTTWIQVACSAPPSHRYEPARGRAGFTVGNGNDYAAQTASLTSSATGTFPTITGLKKETDAAAGGANVYSLQLNSNFFKSSPTCDGALNPAKCQAWEQFVFAEDGSGELFMQYWLINYAAKCPSGGWMKFDKDCYRNSKGVGVPAQLISALGNLALTGSVVAGGLDTITLMTADHAYSVTGQDSVVDLADFWNASEFNVIGDGDASEAKFNTATAITVNIALDDGTTAAPTCESNAGTTGETNSLTLGACTATGGATPSITFAETK